jgi:uncharacterized protein with HEPN domain
MPVAAAKYLWDAETAAERILRFVAGRSLDDYLADDMLRAAVERQFESLGKPLPASAASIPISQRKSLRLLVSSHSAMC